MSGAGADGRSSLDRMIEVFDVTPAAQGRYTGFSDGGSRAMVDGSQFLAQAVVVAALETGKTVRSAKAVFSRMVRADRPVEFVADVVHSGKTMSTVEVGVEQGGRRCVTVLVLADVPAPDVISGHATIPDVPGPDESFPCEMPMTGREIRLVDVADVNADDRVGPPELYAWVRYRSVPDRHELAQALLAHFTGHLGISTALRPHAGLSTSMAHGTLSTAPLAIDISFHAPARWDGWILYAHHAVYSGAGAACVAGTVHTRDGELLATFTQQAMIRGFADAVVSARPEHARL